MLEQQTEPSFAVAPTDSSVVEATANVTLAKWRGEREQCPTLLAAAWASYLTLPILYRIYLVFLVLANVVIAS